MGNFRQKYREGSSSSPHAEQVGSVQIVITEMSVEYNMVYTDISC